MSVRGQVEPARAAFAEAIAAHAQLATIEPDVPDHESNWGSALGNLATSFGRQRDWGGARPLLEQAVAHQQKALQKSPRHPLYLKRLRGHYDMLGDVLVELGDHRAAAAVAGDWSRAGAAQAYDAAILLARCIPVAANDPRLSADQRTELAGAYGAQAVGLLRQAITGNAKLGARLQSARGFDVLRSRADFQDLLRAAGRHPTAGPKP